jgi:hypothetical protein
MTTVISSPFYDFSTYVTIFTDAISAYNESRLYIAQVYTRGDVECFLLISFSLRRYFNILQRRIHNTCVKCRHTSVHGCHASIIFEASTVSKLFCMYLSPTSSCTWVAIFSLNTARMKIMSLSVVVWANLPNIPHVNKWQKRGPPSN